jgi:hypothetical protein
VSILKSLGYPNRFVAILTPIVAPLAGWFASFLADRIPGIPKSALNEIFIAGAILVLAPALQFVHGRLKWDLQQDQKETLAVAGAVALAGADTEGGLPPSLAQFAELGIEAPVAAAPVAATPMMDDADEDADDDEDFDVDADDDEENASTDILDEVGDLLDDDEELDGFSEPLQTTPTGG